MIKIYGVLIVISILFFSTLYYKEKSQHEATELAAIKFSYDNTEKNIQEAQKVNKDLNSIEKVYSQKIDKTILSNNCQESLNFIVSEMQSKH